MGFQFGNPLVGGVTLIRPAIQSPNFSQASKTGWAIMANGDAIFYGLVASIGDQLVFVDSNTYSGGGGGSSAYIFGNPAAATNDQSVLYLVGPTDNVLQPILQLLGESDDGTQQPYAALFQFDVVTNLPDGGVPFAFSAMPALPAALANAFKLFANANGTPAVILQSGLNGTFPIVQTDTSTNTAGAAATSATALTKAWTIESGDPQTGTVYEIETPVTGTDETAVLNIGLLVDGATFTNIVPVLGSAFTAGHGFAGFIRLKLTCTGAGTYNLDMHGELQDSSVDREPSTSMTLDGHASGHALSTNASHTIAIAAFWASNVTGQTISGITSEYRRRGP